ncbi:MULTISPECIES: nuclear transport factor 2 family protein [unclassified Streptomyces]|jgi:ketosteroid isomerase-like protein|uniref:nuclear transport factor 2 family protein n=1 Tax=unclassified Streptomyces TaxID=2593676 RepID=UPI0034518F7A
MSFPAMPKAVHQFYAGSLAADAELWGAGFAEDALFHDPVGSEPIRGREAILAKLRKVIPLFDPFIGITPIEAYTTGGETAVSWRGAVVTTDGNPVNWSGISVFKLNDEGLISEARLYFHHGVFAAQAQLGDH